MDLAISFHFHARRIPRVTHNYNALSIPYSYPSNLVYIYSLGHQEYIFRHTIIQKVQRPEDLKNEENLGGEEIRPQKLRPPRWPRGGRRRNSGGALKHYPS